MNQFQQVLANAAEAERTHWDRHNARVRAWYEQHPEMLQPIIGEASDGRAVRDSRRTLTAETFCGTGWMERVGRYYKGKHQDDAVYWGMPTLSGATQTVELRQFLKEWNSDLRAHYVDEGVSVMVYPRQMALPGVKVRV